MCDTTDIKHAIAEADEKIDPSEAPVCTFMGSMVMPKTDSKPMVVFETEDGGTVAVRLEDRDEVDSLVQNLQALIA